MPAGVKRCSRRFKALAKTSGSRPKSEEETSAVINLVEVRRALWLASRIVANEGIVDAFGLVSMRRADNDNPNRYLLSRSRATEDFIECDLESRPVREPGATQYSERVIHGEIDKARPEVNAACHHHCFAFTWRNPNGRQYRGAEHRADAVVGI